MSRLAGDLRYRPAPVPAHRIQSLMSADMILVLDKGRIVQRGTHEELVARHGIYRSIYDMQARVEVELRKEMAGVDIEPSELMDEPGIRTSSEFLRGITRVRRV